MPDRTKPAEHSLPCRTINTSGSIVAYSFFMPFGSQVAAAPSQWRVLLLGPESQAPLLIATLETIDPHVSIDHVANSTMAQRCLLSPVRYDATFVLDSIDLDTDEQVETFISRLSAGRHPPPLLRITTRNTTSAGRALASFIPVAIAVDSIGVRALIRSLRLARELHRSTRLSRLTQELPDRLETDEFGRMADLDPVLDDLVDAIDVLGGRLTLTSLSSELIWEITTGQPLGDTDPATSRLEGVASSPVLTLRSESPNYAAELRLGPLAPRQQRDLHGRLRIMVDAILEMVEQASQRRSNERTRRTSAANETTERRLVAVRDNAVGSPTPAPTHPATSPPRTGSAPDTAVFDSAVFDSAAFDSASLDSAGLDVAELSQALPTLETKAVIALLHADLVLLHQPIMSPSGSIIESDMLLGVTVGDDRSLRLHSQVVDLGPLDAVATTSTATIAHELTVTTGRWLIATAIPRLRRLINSGGLESGHRIHLSLLHRQLADPRMVGLIIDLLDHNDVEPRSLAIDVAEPTLAEHHDTISAMARLAQFGTTLFLSGFGGAGSNFTLLRTPLVRGVRLSEHVVRGVSLDRRQASIVAGLVALCDELGLEVIATGVDSLGDLEWLTTVAHVSVQGHVIGQPRSEDTSLDQHIA